MQGSLAFIVGAVKMDFIEQNQHFVKKIYKEIENVMLNHFEKGHTKPRIFEYISPTTKAFCMPEINLKSDAKVFKKTFKNKLDIVPVAKIGTKLVLVAYLPLITAHEDALERIYKLYQNHPIEKIRGKAHFNGLKK